MAKGTISLPTAFRHQADKERSHQKAESFPGLPETRCMGICPPACLMQSKPLSSGGEQGVDKGMQWVKKNKCLMSCKFPLQRASCLLITDLLNAAFHYCSLTLLSLYLFPSISLERKAV